MTTPTDATPPPDHTTADASEPAEAATDAPDVANAHSDAPETAPEAAATDPGREAAKYRRQLRDTEAQRDALAARLETAHRREVDRMLSEGVLNPATGKQVSLAIPDALWLVTSMDKLLDADGNLDPVAVADAILAGIDAGLAVKQDEPRIPTPLYTGEQRSPVRPSSSPALENALKPKGR